MNGFRFDSGTEFTRLHHSLHCAAVALTLEEAGMKPATEEMFASVLSAVAR